MFVAERPPPRAALSPVGTPCFGRHVAPTELEEAMFGASVLQTCRSYGTFKELFELLRVAKYYLWAIAFCNNSGWNPPGT